ncbi:MAG: hypothetical protein H7Y28_00365 [Rhodoferax sp.]|nr:hypothetical protein [Rhodoferax sp.]
MTWLDSAIALLVVGLSSAITARRAGTDGTLRQGAVWVTRACSLGIVLCAVVATL